jgi:hypothetical protein
MSERPRDWDRELAEIDKAIERTPPAGPPARVPGAAPAPGAPVGPSGPPISRGRDRAGTWVRTLLAVALGVALPLWPYAHRCGLGLLLYSGAIGVLLLTSLWAMAGSWRHRQGLAHIASTLTLLWGLGLAAMVVLPRIGYAREVLPWMCS